MTRRRSRTKRKHKSTAANQGGFLLFISTRILAGLAFAVILILLYLDLEIRQRFSGNIQSQPAHVFSRAIDVEPGMNLGMERIVHMLDQRGFVRVSAIDEPGTYSVGTAAMDIYLRAFHGSDESKEAIAVRIMFSGKQIKSIIDHSNGNQIDQVLIEPYLIGSLQLGPYKDRIALKLHEMPELLIKALLAMEDRKFETHIGIDPRAIARALWSNIREGKAIQGGSTLTQQLVKNLFLTPQRTLGRKATEALMALVMEMRFSKAEILELYLNEIFLGQSGNRAVHGFALASEFYFGRGVDQLKLHETALLVGMIPAPSYYNPRRHPERAKSRRNLVLNTLADVGAITRTTAEQLSAMPLNVIEFQSKDTSAFPAYLDYLHRQLRQYYSEEILRTNGLKLFTSLDTSVQRHSQDALTETLSSLEKQKGIPEGVLQGAIIVVDPDDGDILALVGDRVKGFSGFNRAIDAERPIGSLVKPAIYLTALERPGKYSLSTILDDSPLTLAPRGGEPWSPQNYDKLFRGPVPLYQALIKSYNLPTVRLGLDIGVESVIETMHRLGVDRDIENYPSTLLGASQHTPLEIAQIYQAFANDGVLIPLRSIQSIHNHRNERVASFSRSEHRVIDQNSAYLLDYLLKMVVQQGTAAGLARSFSPALQLAGKTGTTDNFRDSWFAGYSDNLLAVVWIGRDDNKPINLSGSRGAMRVWEQVMSALSLQRPSEQVNQDIVMVDIDPQSGLVANYKCPAQQPLPFVRGSEPEAFAPCSGLAAKLKSWFTIKRGDVSSGVEVIEIDPSISRP